MKVFHVAVNETLSRTISVQADNPNDAFLIVRNAWRNSEFVLDAGDFFDVDFNVVGISQSYPTP